MAGSRVLVGALALFAEACGSGEPDASSADATASGTSGSATSGGPAGSTAPTADGTASADATGEGESDGDGSTTGEPPPGTYAPPYDPGFALNLPIPGDIPDDARSDDVVAQLVANVATTKVAVATRGEVPSLYTVSADDPLYDVDAGESLGGLQFRVPPDAMSGGGDDDPITILDPMHPTFGADTELRMWQVTVDHDQQQLTASAAGLFHYNNDGAALNPDGTPSLAQPFEGWGTGSGLSYYAGLVHHREIDDGVIPHAIRFSYSCAHATDTFRAPATKTDQPHPICGDQNDPTGAGSMEMGMRLQLDPSVDCDARTTPVPRGTEGELETRFLRMLCHAMQDYGMVMLDGTGPGGLVIYMENELTADWAPKIGLELYDSYSYIVRDQTTPDDGLARGPTDGIPWDRMRVLATSTFD